jgi:hypothetical protein
MVRRGLAPLTIPRRGLTREAQPSQPPTAREVPVKPITQTPGLTREAHQPRTPTEARRSVKPTTQTPERMAPRVKPPTLTGTTEARLSPRTARVRTPSIRPLRKDLWDRYKRRRVARVLPRQERTATLPWARLQMATSMRPQTAMLTRTPGAVGSKLRELRGPLQVTREPIPRLQRDGDSRREAAGHPLSAEAGEAVGNPGRRALVVRQAAVVAAGGAVAGKAALL